MRTFCDKRYEGDIKLLSSLGSKLKWDLLFP
uniref:Uncharacterized protein n=1 Tax=Rhizophora mucronata TaxID=61149 RepID=A0A2P2PYX5_RHIMU